MIPNQAIEKAIDEGGFTDWEAPCSCKLMADENGCLQGFHYKPWEEIAFMPTFWQALGKALGWADVYTWGPPEHSHSLPKWQFEAERFVTLILTGGDTEKFWEEILK